MFLSERDMKEIFAGIKMSQEYYHLIICQTAKTLLQDHDTQDYKRLSVFFFSSHSNHNYAKSQKRKEKKREKQKRKPISSVKIDKRDKLLKLVECPFRMEKRLLWSDTKRDMLKK